MVGKTVKFALGSKKSLMKTDKILKQVEVYIDGESGTLYIVPKDDDEIETNMFLKDSRDPFETFI